MDKCLRLVTEFWEKNAFYNLSLYCFFVWSLLWCLLGTLSFFSIYIFFSVLYICIYFFCILLYIFCYFVEFQSNDKTFKCFQAACDAFVFWYLFGTGYHFNSNFIITTLLLLNRFLICKLKLLYNVCRVRIKK